MRKLLLVMIIMGIFISCNDDFLNKYPVTTINPSTFWQDESEAEMAVNDLYRFLPTINEQIRFDNKTDISIFPGSTGNDLVYGLVDPTFGEFQTWWTNHYRAVSAANRFLEGIELVPKEKISIEKYERFRAEARFIRAMSYTYLTNYFGDVPLFMHEITVSEALEITRTSKQQVIAFIEKELTEAANILPAKYENTDIGRITKGAALAWKARAMLWAKQYDKAVDAAKAVMDMELYELDPDYSKLFKYAGEFSTKEIILERIYSAVNTHNFMNIAAPYGITSQSTSLNINPTRVLVDSYETINGLFITEDPDYDPEDPYRNRDPRLQATIWLPLFKEGAYADTLWNTSVPHDCRPGSKTKDEVQTNQAVNMTGFLMKKYINIEDMANPALCSQNFIILRYADVLLMYAESRNEVSGPDQSVYDAVNMVRNRAGLPVLPANLSKEAMRERIHQERKVELAMEGWRFYDIRRWDIAQDLMKGSQPIPGMHYRDINTNELKTVVWTSAFWNYLKKNDDHTFPVPFAEYDMNPNLLPQNSGW
ncbi:Starch-binding associating with outer membrane [Porphyromonadaceae bacterium KH3R12]|nr:Starch-binding associating with outer membrane [Porphyromonadaceae bacterium KH3R12]